MKTGLFGGTFNPLHYGHLRAAEEAMREFSLDRVIFIPSANPPLKRFDIAPAADRYNMVKSAIAENAAFEVSDIEITRKGASYTIDTLGEMLEIYRGADISFMLGMDAFLDMVNWYKPDGILDIVQIIVFLRPPYDEYSIFRSPFVIKDTIQNVTQRCSEAGLINGRRLVIFRQTAFDISSTLIRSLIKTGKTIKYLLPDSVESYIIKGELYK